MKSNANAPAIHDLLARRTSPYSFADRLVSTADLRALFEAARWAASSYNEQPWRYVVASRQSPGAYERLLGCLVEANQAWAKVAPVLALGIVATRFSRNAKPNEAARHDLGAASAQLTLEATARGLVVHQMIGIDPARAADAYALPDGFEALTALAIGYEAGPTDDVPERFRERDATARERRSLAESIFGERFGEAADWLD